MKKGIAILVLTGIMGFSAVNTAQAGNLKDCLNGLLGRLQGSSAEEVLPPVAEEVPDAPAPNTQGGIHLLPYINLGRSPEGRIGGQIGLRFGIFRSHDIRFGLDCI